MYEEEALPAHLAQLRATKCDLLALREQLARASHDLREERAAVFARLRAVSSSFLFLR